MMRVALLAIPFALLTACGGAETSEANNGQANSSNSASPATTSNRMAMVAVTKVSGAEAARIMHERHEGMESIGKNFKAIHRELEAGSPDVALIRSSAKMITDLSRKASGWFPQGTGPDVAKTGAKPEIWQDPKDFAAKLAAFQKAAPAFAAATSGNDIAAIKAHYADLGGTCKACHDKYRSEMHH
jgi:cytochrome c556